MTLLVLPPEGDILETVLHIRTQYASWWEKMEGNGIPLESIISLIIALNYGGGGGGGGATTAPTIAAGLDQSLDLEAIKDDIARSDAFLGLGTDNNTSQTIYGQLVRIQEAFAAAQSGGVELTQYQLNAGDDPTNEAQWLDGFYSDGNFYAIADSARATPLTIARYRKPGTDFEFLTQEFKWIANATAAATTGTNGNQLCEIRIFNAATGALQGTPIWRNLSDLTIGTNGFLATPPGNTEYDQASSSPNIQPDGGIITADRTWPANTLRNIEISIINGTANVNVNGKVIPLGSSIKSLKWGSEAGLITGQISIDSFSAGANVAYVAAIAS